LQLAVYRRTAWELVLRPPGEKQRPELLKLHQDWKDFLGQLADALAANVDADAQRAPAGDLPELRERYVEALARIVALFAPAQQSELIDKWEPAVAKFAARQPQWKDEPKRHRLATEELLRWRQRCVELETRRSLNKIDDLPGVYFKAATQEGTRPGFHPPRTSSFDSAITRYPALEVLSNIDDRVYRTPGWLRGLVSPVGLGRSLARSQAHMLVRVVVPPHPKVQHEIATLRQVLYAPQGHAPATLSAAVSLLGAEQGNYDVLVASLSSITVDSYLARFTALPKNTKDYLALGEIAVDPADKMQADRIFIRLDAEKVELVGCRYFVVPLK
jgi:hypothetical protein